MSLSCFASASAFFAAASGSRFGVAAGFSEPFVAGVGNGELSRTAFFNSSSLRFFFSCLAKSSAFVSLAKAIVLPSGAQTGLLAPFGRSLNENESPPDIGKIDNCDGSGLPSFSVARKKSKHFPSGDQRGA